MTSAASGLAARRIASPIAASRRVGEQQLRHDRGHLRQIRLGDDDGAAGGLEVAGVLRLVVCGHVRGGDEHGRLPGGRDLPDRPAGACDHEIGGSERRGEVVRPRQEPVVGPQVTADQLLRIALAAQMEHGRALGAPRLDGEIVQRLRALAAAEDEHAPAPPRAGRTGGAPPPARPRRRAGRAARRPDTSAPRARAPGTRETPVAQTVRRSGSRGRGAHPPPSGLPGSASSRPRRPSAPPRIRRRRARRPASARQGCARTRAERGRRGTRRAAAQARPARQARDPERVELVPGLGDESRLDPVRRAGEADADAALPQRFGDRERRQDVAGGPAGRDHAPELRARVHRSARC